MGPAFDERGPATDEAVVGLALGLTEEFPDPARARAGRRRASGCGPGRCARPGRRSGWAARRRPPCAARPGSPTAGCPSRSAPTSSCWPRCASCGPSTATARRSTSARSPTPCTSGTPPAGNELPPGTVQGDADTAGRVPAPRTGEAGCGQVQVRFPAHSVEELCDQIAAFGAEVIPLVDRR